MLTQAVQVENDVTMLVIGCGKVGGAFSVCASKKGGDVSDKGD